MQISRVADEGMRLGVHAHDWRDAVRIAGQALVDTGVARPEYAERMVQAVEEFGPYIVIAPGLALAHARPGPDVLSDGFAVVTLDSPVNFGHASNDPVLVVLALAVTGVNAHVGAISDLAVIFDDPAATVLLAAASSGHEVRAILSGSRSGS